MSSIWTIRRSTTDTKLTGLCGGIAHHWGVDPVLVRVGCVLLALSGGIGVVLYLAGWLLIPIEGSDRAPVDDFFGSTGRRWSREAWITLVVVACFAVFALFGSVSPFGVAPAVVIAVIWYFGFYKNRAGRSSAAGSPSTPHASTPTASTPTLAPPTPPQFFRYPGPPTPFTEAADLWRQRIEENARQAAPQQRPVSVPAPAAEWPTYPAGAAVAGPSDPAVADRHAFLASPDPVGLYTETEPVAATALVVRPGRTIAARRLRLVSLLVVGLALATLAILDGQGVAIAPAAYLGTALLIVGLTLVASAWFGRARGLLPIGVLLAIGLAMSSAAGQVTQLDDFNPAPKVYTQVAEWPANGDSFDVGNQDVDLRQVTLTKDVAYGAHLDAGQLKVIVPSDVNVRIKYSVDAGQVEAFGEQLKSGTDLKAEHLEPAVDPKRPTLTLDLSVDVGTLEVVR